MKNLLALALVLISGYANAAATSATPVRVPYSGGAVSSQAWYELDASLLKPITGIMLSHSGSVALKVAIGPAGSEATNLIIPPSQTQAALYPLVVSGLQRISIQFLSSTGMVGAEPGVGVFNFLYN